MFTPRACSMMFGTLAAVIAFGAVPQDYKMDWHAAESGGGSGTGGEVTLNCTIGQAIAGNGASGGYMLFAGYWGRALRTVAPGDCNSNGVVELDDFACFVNCFTGRDGMATAECALFDLNSDGRVDDDDYATFLVQFGN